MVRHLVSSLDHLSPSSEHRRTVPRAATYRVGALVLRATIAAVCAVLLPSQPGSTPPTFVDRALGAPSADASLEQRFATGASLAVDRAGISARAGAATIELASRNTGRGNWQRYSSGVTRATSFGHESILFGINRAEQFLTVDRRQGTRTWSWRLGATHGTPHLDPAGGVSFARRLPHPAGRDPRHAAVATSRRRGCAGRSRESSGWVLGLRLDDRKLPQPYLIDPIALIAPCALTAGPGGTTSCTAATSTGSSSLAITKPSGAVAGDVMTAQVTVRSTGAITPPAGWTQIGTTAQDAAGPIEQAVFWHLVDGTESSPITFTWAGGNADASGGIGIYKGVDPFVGFDASAVTSMTSGGTPATGNPAGLAVTTSAANEMLQAAYGVANGVTVAQTAGQGLARDWTVLSAGGTKVTAGFSDGVQAAAGASGNKTATWVTSSLWAAHLYALKNEAADGSGTVAASFTTASASQAGLTQTLTYTPAAGSMANGSISFVVPVGWTAPQATTPAAAGYLSATGGTGTNTIAVTGTGPWTVTVSGITLNQGLAQTLVLKYGDTSGGGPGATATATAGAVAWSVKQRSSSRGTLTAVTGVADGDRLRRRRHRNDGVEPLDRVGLAGRADRDAHVHRRDRWDVERHDHGRGAGRVDATRNGGRPGLHDLELRRRLCLRADDHRQRHHTCRGGDGRDHLRLRRDCDSPRRSRRADLADQAKPPPPAGSSPRRRRRRRSRSTRSTAPERQRRRPRTSQHHRRGTRSSSPTPSRPATCRTGSSS